MLARNVINGVQLRGSRAPMMARVVPTHTQRSRRIAVPVKAAASSDGQEFGLVSGGLNRARSAAVGVANCAEERTLRAAPHVRRLVQSPQTFFCGEEPFMLSVTQPTEPANCLACAGFACVPQLAGCG